MNTRYENIANKIQEILGEEYSVKLQSMAKTNVVLSGLCILKKGDTCGPTIYLESYDHIESEEDAVQAIYSQFMDEFSQSARKINSVNITEVLSSGFEQIRKKLRIKLINREWNSALLEDENLVWKEYLDLAAVLNLDVSELVGCDSSCNVNKNLLKLWNVTADDAFAAALDNMREKCIIKDMMSLFSGTEVEPLLASDPVGMYIMTAKPSNTGSSLYGAGMMLLTDVIREYAQGENVCILPSSLHEVILIKVGDSTALSLFTSMVIDVNRTQVDVEERLSDHAYLYRADLDRIVY